MTFAQAMDKIGALLRELDGLLAAGPEKLRRGTEFGARAEQLALKARGLFTTLPDPVGPTPRTDWEVQVKDEVLVPARQERPAGIAGRIVDLAMTLVGGGTRLRLCVPGKKDVIRSVNVPLDPPMLPGQLGRTGCTATVPVRALARRQRLPTEGWLTRVHQAWLRLANPARAWVTRDFDPMDYEDRYTVRFDVPEYPLERGSNAVAQALIDRRTGLSAEVLAIGTFRARHDKEARDLEDRTKSVRSRADGLGRNIQALEVHPGAAQIRKIGEEIERVGSDLPGLASTLNDLTDKLDALAKEFELI